MARRRASRRLAAPAGVAAALLLAACAAGPDSTTAPADPAAAEAVARLWTGEYAGRTRDDIDPQADFDSGLVRMRVELRRAEPGVASLDVIQTAAADRRRFRVVLRPTRVGTRLSGSFAPLGPDGNEIGGCPLTVAVRPSGFVASTSAETCRFDRAGGSVGLVKEIAHDGSRMVIADRVVDADGRVLEADRIVEFQRVRTFEAWVGVRDDDAGAWRVATPFRLRSDGVAHEPADAGGMPLGVRLELAPYAVVDAGTVALRLRVFDADGGELVGQAWSDPAASRLGLAVRGIQVGLRAVAGR